MDTSCVLCLALSLQIYIKQCSTASVSLHLCCTCHLSICLAACLLASLSHLSHLFFFSSSPIFLLFHSYINLGQANLGLCVCVGMYLLSQIRCCHFEKSLKGFCLASCTVTTLILHRSSSLWLSTFQRAAEFDISFHSLFVCFPSVLDINISRGSLFFFWQKNPGIYFSNLLRLSSSPSIHFFPLPSLSADPPLILPLPLKNRKWNSFCSSNLTLPPFITQKPWFPAMAVSHSPNELILHERRIPSYLCRVGPLPSLSLSFLHRSLLLPAQFI